MMSDFLEKQRDELIHRCNAKVTKRPMRQGTALQLSEGIPHHGSGRRDELAVCRDGVPQQWHGQCGEYFWQPAGPFTRGAQQACVTEQQELLLHALPNALATASYAVAAMELGNLAMSGSTGSLLKKSLEAMRSRVDGPTLAEMQNNTGGTD